MTKTEILAALKNLTAEERLEIIETASRMMREEIEEKAQRKAERKRKLRAAAEAAVPCMNQEGRFTICGRPTANRISIQRKNT